MLLLASKFATLAAQNGFYILTNIPIAFCLFGLTRASEHSYVATCLSHEFFTSFVPYTYAAYILHFPFYYYANFIRANHIKNYGEFFATLFGDNDKNRIEYSEDDVLNFRGPRCGMPWGAHVLVFCITIIGAQVSTILFHKPMTKLLTRTRFFHRTIGPIVDIAWRPIGCILDSFLWRCTGEVQIDQEPGLSVPAYDEIESVA